MPPLEITQPDLFGEPPANAYPGWKPHPDSASAYEAEATLLREGKLRPDQSVMALLFPKIKPGAGGGVPAPGGAGEGIARRMNRPSPQPIAARQTLRGKQSCLKTIQSRRATSRKSLI